jgi:NADH dehydrogenase (ubiquinone) Fe-S protein 6
MSNPPETIYTDKRRVSCDGATDIRAGAVLGHPRVWLEIDEKGWVECGYCDRRFVLKGGEHDRQRNEVFPGELDEAGASTSAESRGPTGI